MKKIWFIIVLLSVFLIACQPVPEVVPEQVEEVKEIDEQPTVETTPAEVNDPPKEPVVEEIEAPTKLAPVSCTTNTDCEDAKKCIDGECKTIADLYETDCETKCNFKSVEVKTSDDETYTLNRGRGAYTGAGSLAWSLEPGPDYCPGDKVIVPITLEKINYGEVLEEQVITISPGETSDRITHPTNPRIDFTLNIASLDETCG